MYKKPNRKQQKITLNTQQNKIQKNSSKIGQEKNSDYTFSAQGHGAIICLVHVYLGRRSYTAKYG